jgi:hypothetical protein
MRYLSTVAALFACFAMVSGSTLCARASEQAERPSYTSAPSPHAASHGAMLVAEVDATEDAESLESPRDAGKHVAACGAGAWPSLRSTVTSERASLARDELISSRFVTVRAARGPPAQG